ncbi:response regulator [Pseudomonas sp. ZM23]|uniref:histidine kinase n=1 Tax=Pseudomonas triclosanedens TaxID=2961893 RepID=A0ABY7A2W8_9PSED|nr:response regulator [Pseudomonas triclosanedens]MCP8464708.1 response regulator [Pseudomonas triclosanedens]MCP8470579.1 response regulator [Pseudomonas triclosanedens]WAI51389.1 response regulator [Pseudomonas triclosanedens]
MANREFQLMLRQFVDGQSRKGMLASIEQPVLKRMFIYGMTMITCIVAVYAVFFLYNGMPHHLLNVLTNFAGIAVAAFIAWRWGNYRCALLFMNSSAFVMVTINAVYQGGVGSPAFWWMSVLPFATVLGGSMRAGIVQACVLVVFVALHALGAMEGWLPALELAKQPGLHKSLSVVFSTLYFLLFLILSLRWKSLLTQALYDALKMAHEATEAKARFLANMSHEIRTPMNAIHGLGHLLGRTKLDDCQRDHVRKIMQASQHLLGIINDILDYSKIEAGCLKVEKVPFDLPNMLHEVRDLLAERAQAKGLHLTLEVDAAIPHGLIGDSLRLSQILLNLGDNAVKFTRSGRVSMTVECLRADDKDVLLRFSVLDTGIGLSDAQKTRLFQDFTQADESTTRQYGGTGLGLAISKRLVELMGGEIGVNSEFGKGATFWFTLPLRRDGAPQIWQAATQANRRVLVIDNDAHDRQALCQALRSLGAEPCEAANGEAALAALQTAVKVGTPYEAVLVDWRMSEMDGLQVISAIKTLALTPAPRLALVTSYAHEQLQALDLGADTVLLKPVPADLLGAALWPRTEEAPAPAAPASSSASSLKGARVLVAEDNLLNRHVLLQLLAEFDVLAEFADNGCQALQMASQKSYDAILMDIQMPEMDGVEATIRLRERPEFAQLPIIALTANVMEDERQRCLAAGMNDFLAKPVEPYTLQQTLRHWISNERGADAAEKTLASREQTEPWPIVIQGLDMDTGLRYVMGKYDTYLTFVQEFAHDQAGAAEQVAQALSRGDWQKAGRMVHICKGLAATIGASACAQVAAELEQALRKKHGDPELQARFEAELASVVSSIRSAMPAAPPGAEREAATGVDSDSQRAVAAMREMLRSNDMTARWVWDDNAAVFLAMFGQRFDELQQAVHEVNYPLALRILDEITRLNPAWDK